ncbi:hypothetical protein CapIbe_004795 [Capra ibex]
MLLLFYLMLFLKVIQGHLLSCDSPEESEPLDLKKISDYLVHPLFQGGFCMMKDGWRWSERKGRQEVGREGAESETMCSISTHCLSQSITLKIQRDKIMIRKNDAHRRCLLIKFT